MFRFLALVLLPFAGCASPARATVAPLPTPSKHAKDIRFARVDIDRARILTAVEMLCAEIDKLYGVHGGRYLTWAYTAGPFPGTPEGPVTFHDSDVSVRQLLDEFCRQTGWTYRWVNIGMVEFQNGPVPGHQLEIRRPRPNQSMQLTPSRTAFTFYHD